MDHQEEIMRRIVRLVEDLQEEHGMSLDDIEKLVMSEQVQQTRAGEVRVLSREEIDYLTPIIKEENRKKIPSYVFNLPMWKGKVVHA